VIESDPFNGTPPVVVSVTLSFGSQFWAELAAAALLTVKHSVVAFVWLDES
jgi:hypothetical protein